MKMIDEQLYTIRLDLAKEKKIREETHEHSYSQFGEQLKLLSDEVINEGHLREEGSQRLIAMLSDEIGKFHEVVVEERIHLPTSRVTA